MKTKTRKQGLWAGIIVLGIIVLVIISFAPKTSEETIKIGAALPLTGVASIHGQNERQGIDLAVKEINSAGGIDGKKIEIIYEDDTSQPPETLTAVKKLIELDNVEVIIGGTWDILANAAIPEIDQQQVVLLSPSALPDTVTQESPYFFSVHSPVSINQKAVEGFIDDNSIKTVGILVVNNPWGIAHNNMFKAAIQESGATFTEERIVQNFDNNDLSTELADFKNSEVDAIFTAINFNDMALLGRKLVELNIESKVLAHSNFKSTIEAGRLPIEAGEGVTVFKFSEPSQEFIDNFEQEYGRIPEIYSDIAYDTVYIIKEVIENYGYSSEEILQGLKQVDFQGASGRIYFGENNYPMNKQPILEVM